MLRDNLELNSGLVRFQSRESATAYLETLLQYYKSRQEEYGQQLAEHLRSSQSPQPQKKSEEKEQKKDKKDKKDQQPVAKGWARVGSLPVNTSDPLGARAQVTLRIVEDYKSRVEKVSEALKSFSDVDSLGRPGTSSYTLFVFKGVPEGVIVEAIAKKEVFAFAGRFRAV